EPALALPQEQVLRDLLRDRTRSANAPAALAVLERLVDLLEVEAVVHGKELVLGCDYRERRLLRDRVPVAPFVAKLVVLVEDAADAARQHEHAGGRIDPAKHHDGRDG